MTRFALAATLALLPAALFATPTDNLLEATRNNDVMAVQKLLEVVPVDAVGTNGVSALHVAAGLGYTELASLLVEGGADLNARSALGKTPLMLAAEQGHADIAALLLEAGARADLQDKTGATALTWASGYGHRDIAAALQPLSTPLSAPVAVWKWFVPLGVGLLGFLALHGTAGQMRETRSTTLRPAA